MVSVLGQFRRRLLRYLTADDPDLLVGQGIVSISSDRMWISTTAQAPESSFGRIEVPVTVSRGTVSYLYM